MKTREVFVTNIPIRMFAEGYVSVPESTSAEDLNEAVKTALLDSGYRPAVADSDIDEELIKKWVFSTPSEER